MNRDLALISAALNRLVGLGQLWENPAAKVPMAKEKKRGRVALSKEDARRLVAAAEPWFRSLLIGAFYTGARLGELLALPWGDVDLESNTILLRRTKVGNASRIPLHPALAGELQAVKKRWPKISKDGDPVFVTEKGTPPGDTRRPWDRTVKAAGLEGRKGLTFHSTRHTFAVHYLEGGAAITDLQELLGHTDVATTMVYAKMVDARTRASLEAMDMGFDGEEAPILSADEARQEAV